MTAASGGNREELLPLPRGASGETVYFEGTAKASPIRGGGTPQA